MARTSWIHRIKNFDKLKKAFDNLKVQYDLAKDANTRKKHQLTAIESKYNNQLIVIRGLKKQIVKLRGQLAIVSKEPIRKQGCDKPRIDTDFAAKLIRDQVASSLNKPMWYYHCRTCPPSPLTHQRYYHLTSQDREDNCG